MRIISTLFKHAVYDGLHEALRRAAEKVGGSFVACDDAERLSTRVMLRNTNYILHYPLLVAGLPLKPKLTKDDILVVRSILNTSQPFSYLLKGRRVLVCEEYLGNSKKKNRIYKFLAKAFFSKAIFLAQTPRTFGFLHGLGLNVLLVPTFVPARFSSERGKHILYVARMVDVKNPFFVVELARRMPDKKFIFVTGDDQQELFEEVKSACAKLPNAEFKVKIPRKELDELMRTAELLILPSKSDPIGYTVPEALSFATPALTTIHAGSAGYMPKEWVLEELDPAAWEKKIREICADPKSREKAKKALINAGLELDGKTFNGVVAGLSKKLTQKSS